MLQGEYDYIRQRIQIHQSLRIFQDHDANEVQQLRAPKELIRLSYREINKTDVHYVDVDLGWLHDAQPPSYTSAHTNVCVFNTTFSSICCSELQSRG